MDLRLPDNRTVLSIKKVSDTDNNVIARFADGRTIRFANESSPIHTPILEIGSGVTIGAFCTINAVDVHLQSASRPDASTRRSLNISCNATGSVGPNVRLICTAGGSGPGFGQSSTVNDYEIVGTTSGIVFNKCLSGFTTQILALSSAGSLSVSDLSLTKSFQFSSTLTGIYPNFSCTNGDTFLKVSGKASAVFDLITLVQSTVDIYHPPSNPKFGQSVGDWRVANNSGTLDITCQHNGSSITSFPTARTIRIGTPVVMNAGIFGTTPTTGSLIVNGSIGVSGSINLTSGNINAFRGITTGDSINTFGSNANTHLSIIANSTTSTFACVLNLIRQNTSDTFGVDAFTDWRVENRAGAFGILSGVSNVTTTRLSIAETTGVVTIPSTVESTSNTTGALVVSGGVGIAGNINVNKANATAQSFNRISSNHDTLLQLISQTTDAASFFPTLDFIRHNTSQLFGVDSFTDWRFQNKSDSLDITYGVSGGTSTVLSFTTTSTLLKSRITMKANAPFVHDLFEVRPQFQGNWPSTDYWAFGPDSSTADTTVRLGRALSDGTWYADNSYANLRLNTLFGSVQANSDYRLKSNIVPIEHNLDTILKLRPVQYTIDSRHEFGFIAHEIQDILPNIVSGNKDDVNEDGTPKYQSLNYIQVIPILTKCIQELKQQNNSLEDRIRRLEEMISSSK